MTRRYIITLALLVLLSFTACKSNRDKDILLDNDKSENSHMDDSLSENNNADDADGITNPDNDNGQTDIESELTGDIANESDDPVNYYVIKDAVRMRENASLEAIILDLLSKGTEVEYMDRKGEWIKVRYDNKTGYIRNDLLSEIRPMEEAVHDKAENRDSSVEITDNHIEIIENPKIIVKKADRTLQLWDQDTLYASYPIGLGREPIGDKQKEGDGRTPEGTYYICTRNNYSRFYLSLGLSYPNIEDAYEGLNAGLIDQNTYNQIEGAINRGVQPPWNTALGGEIMIHGHGSQSDWTAGCIAVDNDVMDVLWEICRIGTTVIIEP
jgi:L,D-peptidoglycan transpeptidase YkuD (ErfK/YbiS/YcfS/YnhG family)